MFAKHFEFVSTFINSKEDVRKTLKIIDPDWVMIGRKKVIRRRIYHTIVPAYFYHLDGNNKITHWGFQYTSALTESVVMSGGWL